MLGRWSSITLSPASVNCSSAEPLLPFHIPLKSLSLDRLVLPSRSISSLYRPPWPLLLRFSSRLRSHLPNSSHTPLRRQAPHPTASTPGKACPHSLCLTFSSFHLTLGTWKLRRPPNVWKCFDNSEGVCSIRPLPEGTSFPQLINASSLYYHVPLYLRFCWHTLLSVQLPSPILLRPSHYSSFICCDTNP